MPQATTESELRVKLKPVFNSAQGLVLKPASASLPPLGLTHACAFAEFDLDKSGSVSTAEMGKILKAIKMEKTPAEVRAKPWSTGRSFAVPARKGHASNIRTVCSTPACVTRTARQADEGGRPRRLRRDRL